MFSDCSARMLSARISVSPELIIVANCREKIDRSFNPTFGPNPGMVISMRRPVRASVGVTDTVT